MPGDEVYAWADGESILAHEVDEEVEPFKDYYRSRGETFANINLAFRNWLRRSKKFRRNQNVTRRTNGATEDEWDAWERKNGVGKYAPIETEGRMR